MLTRDFLAGLVPFFERNERLNELLQRENPNKDQRQQYFPEKAKPRIATTLPDK